MQFDRGVTRTARGLAALLEALGDVGDIVQPDLLAILQRADFDAAEALGVLAQAETTDLPFRGARRAAGGQILRGFPDPVGDIAKGQVELAQALRSDLDPDFLVPRSEYIDLVAAGVQQVVAQALGDFFQRGFRIGARDDDAGDRVVPDEAPNLRRLAVFRQGRHLADRGLHVRQGRLHVSAGVEFDDDLAAALDGRALHAAHAVEEADLRVERLDDVRIDILRTGAAPLDRNTDHVEAEIGKELGVDLTQGEDADKDHQDH